LCCCNKIPETEQFINNRNLLLTVPEAGKAKIKALTFWCLLRAFLVHPHMVEKEKEMTSLTHSGPLIRALILPRRASSSRFNHLL
jgi:hypothetical protein